ncbi:MAG: hypothetical protein QM771_10995 [Nitrospira sp.]
MSDCLVGMIESSDGNSALGEHRSQRLSQPDGIRGITVKTEGLDMEVEHCPIGCNNVPILHQRLHPREYGRFMVDHRMRLGPGY